MIRVRLLLIAAIAASGAMALCFRGDQSARGQQPPASASKPKLQARAADEPFGINKRIPWTTSRFRGTPDPPLPYRAERVFPKLHFKSPTVLTNAPATDRLFVAEQYGKIFSIPNDPNASAADLFLDATQLVPQIAKERNEDLSFEAVYGVTFHPRFAENRY